MDNIIKLIKLIFLITLLGFMSMLLWNWLMPLIFNLPEISFLQAIGIRLLAAMLFKKFNIDLDDN